MQLNPYISFKGDCETAFKFYEKCLGGKIASMFTFSGSPMERHVPPEWRSKIMHATLMVGDRVLMGSDPPPEHYSPPGGFSISIGVKDPAEAERIFSELAKDGAIRMPIQQTFWAVRFGMLVDRFGIPWMINCEQPA